MDRFETKQVPVYRGVTFLYTGTCFVSKLSMLCECFSVFYQSRGPYQCGKGPKLPGYRPQWPPVKWCVDGVCAIYTVLNSASGTDVWT